MQPTMKLHPRLLFVATLICLSVLVATPAIAQAGLGAVRVDGDGDATTSFIFPPSRAGVFEVVATGPGFLNNFYPPVLNPALAVSPNVIPEGVAVRVAVFLSGWVPNSTVALSLRRLSFAEAEGFRIAGVTQNVTRTARILVVGDRDKDRDRDFDRDFDRDRDRDRDGDVIVNVQGNPPTTVINNNNNNNNLMSGGGGSSASSSASSSSSAGGRGGGFFIPGGGGRGFLVRTGIDSLPLLLAGVGAILLGSVLLAAGRRRRHASSTS